MPITIVPTGATGQPPPITDEDRRSCRVKWRSEGCGWLSAILFAAFIGVAILIQGIFFPELTDHKPGQDDSWVGLVFLVCAIAALGIAVLIRVGVAWYRTRKNIAQLISYRREQFRLPVIWAEADQAEPPISWVREIVIWVALSGAAAFCSLPIIGKINPNSIPADNASQIWLWFITWAIILPLWAVPRSVFVMTARRRRVRERLQSMQKARAMDWLEEYEKERLAKEEKEGEVRREAAARAAAFEQLKERLCPSLKATISEIGERAGINLSLKEEKYSIRVEERHHNTAHHSYFQVIAYPERVDVRLGPGLWEGSEWELNGGSTELEHLTDGDIQRLFHWLLASISGKHPDPPKLSFHTAEHIILHNSNSE